MNSQLILLCLPESRAFASRKGRLSAFLHFRERSRFFPCKALLDFSLFIGYNYFPVMYRRENLICSGIEVVITALTRNQVYWQQYRGFESHPLRQKRNTFCLLAKGVSFQRNKSLTGFVKYASRVKYACGA